MRESEVTQLCLTLSDPMDCSLPGSSVHGIFQARVLEWVPLPSPSWRLEVQNQDTHRAVLFLQVLGENLFCAFLLASGVTAFPGVPWFGDILL